MNIKRILTPLLIILLLFSIVVIGAPNYGNVGPTTEFGFDIKIEDEIVAEGSSADDYETTILFTDPTADRTVTIPDSDQTVGTATSIEDNSIVEVDLKAVDESADEDILTKEDTTGDFEWHSAAEIKALMSLDLVANLKVKLDATGAPTVNNDVDEGYTVGSRWFDVTNDKEYVCLDNTDGAAVWTETTQSGGGGAFTDLTDTPANYTGSSLKHIRVNVGETALEFVTLSGGGDMLKATYDIDEDGDIDVAAGGTEKSSWTQYAIPYLSNTTVFGEIPIGTDNYALTVNGATGYDWTHLQIYDAGLDSLAALTYVSDSFIKVTATDTYAIRTIAEMKTDLSFMTDLVDDTDPDLGGELDAGAHSIGFTLQQFTAVDDTTTIDWTLGNKYEFTFDDENQTFTFTPPTNAQNMMLWLIQDGTGSRTITWPGTCRWPLGVEGVLSTAGGSVDIVGIAWNGTNYDCVINNAFAVP